MMRDVLRVLKKAQQEELCVALLDFIETGVKVPPCEIITEILFCMVTDEDMKIHIRPLRI